jgi:competence ComEA-like helix-hairpin-helix protein
MTHETTKTLNGRTLIFRGTFFGHPVYSPETSADSTPTPESTVVAKRTATAILATLITLVAISASTPATADETAKLVNVNTATPAELETVPSIGPKLAQAIVDYRARGPFPSVERLTYVRGIGAAKLESIRPFVTVDEVAR